MKMLSQTLSLLGLLAVAALIAVVVQALGAGRVPWLPALGVALFAAACFWGAARLKSGK